MASIQSTGCCAFSQLRAGNGDALKDLRDLIMKHDEEVRKKWTPEKLGGAPTLWCVTTPDEMKLCNNLVHLGFRWETSMPRRNGYPEGNLRLWVRTFWYPQKGDAQI